MTIVKHWLFYLLALLLCGFHAFYSTSELSFFLLKLLLITPLISMVYLVLCFLSIRVQVFQEALTINKLDHLILRIKMQNKGPLFIPFVKLIFRADKMIFNPASGSHIISLNPFGTTLVEIKMQSSFVGTFKLDLRGVYLQDLLGIFSLKKLRRKQISIKVLPRILDVSHVNINQKNPFLSPTIETDPLYDIRNYNHGDTMRFVHWKLSAKKNQLMVKDPEKHEGGYILIVLDLFGKNETDLDALIKKDKLIEGIVAFLHYCIIQSINFKLIYYEEETPQIVSNISLHSFNAFINRLAVLELNSRVHVFEVIKKISVGTPIYDLIIFSAVNYKNLAETIEGATQTGINCFYYDVNEFMGG